MAISCRQSQFRRWLSRNPAGYCEIAPQGHFLALRAQGATAPLGPRNDKPLVFAILTAARLFRRCSAGPGCPRPYNGTGGWRKIVHLFINFRCCDPDSVV